MGFPAFEMGKKLRKALFKRGLERNKNVLEFDVEKDGGINF